LPHRKNKEKQPQEPRPEAATEGNGSVAIEEWGFKF